jgi:predicted nucleic acid-binding protein
MGAPLKYLLDTTVLIDHFNNLDPATDFLEKNLEECAVSVVTVAEVLSRPFAARHMEHERFLSSFHTLGLDLMVARLTGALRQKSRWKLPDAFQAALAQRHGLMFVTRNTRDFDPKKYRFVHVPYEL